MANSSVYSSKPKKLVFQPEGTSGTAQTLNGSSVILPASNISLTRDRGTRVISRAAVMDGQAGEIEGCPGSFGSSISFDCELHDIDASASPYWVQLLYAAGFEGAISSPTNTLTLSNKKVVDYSAGSPCSATFALITEVNDHTADYREQTFGVTGNASLTLNAGEIAILNFSGVGLLGDFIDVGTTDLSSIGTTTGLTNCPFKVLSVTATLTPDGGSDLGVVDLSTLTVNMNTTTPDVADPRQAKGFAVSPVLSLEAPTVSFTLAATPEYNASFLQALAAGTPFALEVTLVSSVSPTTNNTIKVEIPFLQYTDVNFADANGYTTYEIEAKAVRPNGSTTAPVTIVWTYA